MVVAFDAVGPSVSGATSSASAVLSWTHTNVGGGVALVVAVMVGSSSDGGLTVSAKLDPAGANTTIPSLGPLIHSGGGTAGFVALFGLPNVSSGAHTITVTASASVPNMEGGSVSYTGADPTAPFGAQQSFSVQNTTTPSITYTGSTPNNRVVAALAHGMAITSATAGTSRWIRNVNSNSAAGNGAMADIVAGGSVVLTWSAASDWCGIAAVEVLATAGPPMEEPRNSDAMNMMTNSYF